MINLLHFVDILLEGNQQLRRALERKVLPTREFMKVPIGGGQRKYTRVSFSDTFVSYVDVILKLWFHLK